MVLVNADDAERARGGEGQPRADPRGRLLRERRGAHPGRAGRRRARRPSGCSNTEFTLPMSGTFNVRNAAMAIAAAHFYQIPLPEIAKAVADLRGREAPAGSPRRGARRDHHRRLRPSPHRHARDAAGPAPSLPAPPALGALRAAQQHDAPRRFPERAARRARAGRRRLRRAGRGAGADPRRTSGCIPSRSWPTSTPRACRPTTSPTPTRSWRKLNPLLKPGDVVVVFSNGGFGGIHQKLLDWRGLSRYGLFRLYF